MLRSLAVFIFLLFLGSSFAQTEKQELKESTVITPAKMGKASSETIVLFRKLH